MPESQFSPDLYYAQLLAELREVYASSLPSFTPLRTLGSTVSYDSGVYADYWKLKVGSRELDSHILRGLLPAQRRALLPNRYLSLFLRVDTPFHVTTSRAKDAEVYESWKERGFRGYYWIETNENLTAGLLDLVQHTSDLALAVCASPTFSTHEELESNISAGTIWQNSQWLPAEQIQGTYRTYVAADRPVEFSPGAAKATGLSMPGTLAQRLESIQPEPFASYLARLWKGIQRGLPADAVDLTKDLELARNALGNHHGRLPLDPLGVLEGLDFGGPLPAGRDLGTLGAVLFAIQRLLRERAGAQWLVFYA